MEPLAEFCRNTDLKERVMFAGFTEHPEQYYIASDVFVFPSYYEAFPLVPMEAAAAGLPIVATRVNGVREWIEDGKTGLLSSFEPTDFAEKILFLANDINARYRFGAAARQAVSEFTVRRMTDSYETLYKSISPTLSDLAKIDKAQNE